MYKMFFNHIPVEDLDKNPKFSELITQLKKRVTPEGHNLHLQKSLEQTKHTLSCARQTWLLQHVLYNEVTELLADLEIRGFEDQLSLNEKQFTEILIRVLAFAELPDYLQYSTDPTSSSSLFGLTRDDITQHNPVDQHIAAVQQTLLPLIEDRLRLKCERLYSFYKDDKDPSSSGLLMTKAQAMPNLVEQKQRLLDQGKVELEGSRRERGRRTWGMYQKLLEGISMMKQMLQQHKLKTQSEVDHVNVSWLKAQCDVFCRKLQLTKLKILCKTYDAETVKALSKINQHLDSALKQTSQELASTQHSLQGYHAVGSEFHGLVEEFTQLQKEVDTRVWGLQRLGVWGAEETAEEQGFAKSLTDGLASIQVDGGVKSKTAKKVQFS